MKKITFKQFKQKYNPIRNHKVPTNTPSPWNYTYTQEYDSEYINNKRNEYVWSIVKDLKEKRTIVIQGKSFDAVASFITTVPFNEGIIEYFKIK